MAGNGKEEGTAAQGPTSAEEAALAQCRALLDQMARNALQLQCQQALLAKLATEGDRAQMRAIAKALRELERALQPAGV